MNPTLAGLLQSCMHASDFDSLPWMILADWLEDHHDPRAVVIRQRYGRLQIDPRDRLRPNYFREPRPPEDFRGWDVLPSWVCHIPRIQGLTWLTRLTLNRLPPVSFSSFPACAEAIAASPCLRVAIRGGLRTGAEMFRRVQPFAASIDNCRWAIDNQSAGDVAWLHTMPNLRRLELNPNHLDAELLMRIGELSSLRQLTIAGICPRVSADWIPLANLKRLESLIICDSYREVPPRDVLDRWTESIPLREFGLTGIHPNDRLQTQDIIDRIVRWSQLRVLRLSGLGLHRVDRTPLFDNLHQLEHLMLSHFRGDPAILMEQIVSLPRLRILELDSYPNSRRSPRYFSALALARSKTLEVLNFRGNDIIYGQSLDTFSAMPSLQWLDVRNCASLSAAACQRFREARPDVTLVADH